MLELQHVGVRFAGLQALSDVSLTARGGAVHALIGPNGAGKTTLFNAISGYVALSAGTIALDGAPIHGLTPHQIAARGLRRTFQNGGLFAELTALENVLAGLHARIDASFAGILFGSRAARAAEREALARARELLRAMGVAHLADQPVKTLSTGGLWKGVDAGLIDGTVNGVGLIVSGASAVLRRTQTGSIRTSAFALFAGAVSILAYYLFS